jgi:hypothetical protein
MKASLLLALLVLGTALGVAQSEPAKRVLPSASSAAEKDGTLVVLVRWGDIDNTPATHVYIEAHGYVVKDDAQESFVLKTVRAGRYEATIPPGVFDVFVSDGTSLPTCKRVLIVSGKIKYWRLKLANDYVFLEK